MQNLPSPKDVAKFLNTGTQTCISCYVEKPLMEQFWHRDAETDNGFQAACKTCRNDQAKHARTQRADDMCDEVFGVLLDNLVTHTKQAKARSAIPHIAEVWEEAMDIVGGAPGMAQMMVAEFIQSKPGSRQREKIMGFFLSMGMKASDTAATDKSLDQMTDRELQTQLDQSALRIIDVKGRSA